MSVADESQRYTASERLSEREVEVVGLVVAGLTNAEIAERLCLSPRTSQAHVARAMRKLRARSRTQLAVFALRSGLVPLHDS